MVEVDCYCEHVLNTSIVDVEDFFKEEERHNAIERLEENNRVKLYAGSRTLIINTDTITYIDATDDKVVIHFTNNKKLIIRKDGKITYLREWL